MKLAKRIDKNGHFLEIDFKVILPNVINQQSGLWNTERPLSAGL